MKPVSKTISITTLLLLIGSNAYADQASSYQDAATFADTQKSNNPAANSTNTTTVPQYTATPPQTSYYGNAGSMATAGNTEAQTNTAGQFFAQSQNRPMFVIDKNTDPVLVRSMQVTSPTNLSNFLKQFGGCYTEQQIIPGAVTQATCEEYRPDQFYTCNKTLNVQAASITRIEYYPSTCESLGVACAPWNDYCTVPASAISKGYYYFFINSSPSGTMTQISSCTSGCDYFEINGMTFGRGTSLSWCDLNNCTSVGVTYTSEGIPVYACTGGASVSSDCPSGYNKTTATDGKVICRESNVATYESNPACQKIGDVPQLSTGGSAKFYWEIWACDAWDNTCTTFEARLP